MGHKDILHKNSISEESLQPLVLSELRLIWSNLSASDIFLCCVFFVSRLNIKKILF